MSAIDGNSSGCPGQYRPVGSCEARDSPDAALFAASISEPHVFGQVFDRHGPAVHRYLTSRVGPDQADDLLSEVFVAAFRRRRSYDPRFATAVPWLLGIAANMVRHHQRSEGRRRTLVQRLGQEAPERPDGFVDDVANDLIGHFESEEVGIALTRLDDRYRDVLILHAAFDLTYEEIAASLGLRLGTVRSRISRGRTKLRELLAASGQYVTDDQRREPFGVEGTS